MEVDIKRHYVDEKSVIIVNSKQITGGNPGLNIEISLFYVLESPLCKS